jgi:hypothetical protein
MRGSGGAYINRHPADRHHIQDERRQGEGPRRPEDGNPVILFDWQQFLVRRMLDAPVNEPLRLMS